MSRAKRHCPTCTCLLTPLEVLVEECGQVEAARRLGSSQAQVSRVLAGGFTHQRLAVTIEEGADGKR